jgi:hypothetical protein
MTSTPTPEQTARAAELAPRVAEIAGLLWHPRSQRLCIEGGSPGRAVDLLDPRAFQAVLLALPPELQLVGEAAVCEIADGKYYSAFRSVLALALTPAGMLAFYEALGI